MLALLKALQSLIKTLHSEGTPTQIALGATLGAALGLTPLVNLHNLVILILLAILNVSFGAGMLAMAAFVPIGFMLDPLFDRLGHLLLVDMVSLRPMWTALDNTPLLALASLGNTVVLGSLVSWVALTIPIFIGVRLFVLHYRRALAPRVEQSRFYRAVSASQIYNVYRWFQP